MKTRNIRAKKSVAIVGAGVHGVTVAIHLEKYLGDKLKLSIIDPEGFMANWDKTTRYSGMTQLRSIWKHSVYGDEKSLRKFANGRQGITKSTRQNPPLKVFNEHARAGINSYLLPNYYICSIVSSLRESKNGSGYILKLHGNFGGPEEIYADFVICCTGIGIPVIPKIEGVRSPLIIHSGGLNLGSRPQGTSRILIVGGGLTSGEVAAALSSRNTHVTIATKDSLLVQPFDFDPGWFGGKLYRDFRFSNSRNRFKMLKEANVQGSITPAVYQKLKEARRKGNLDILENTLISHFKTDENLGFVEATSKDKSLGIYELVILATGYQSRIQDLGFLNGISHKIRTHYNLPVFRGKNPSLQVLPNLYISGSLALHGVGAASPLIKGARLAAGIIADSIEEKLH